MSTTKKTKIRLQQSNRIVNESLEQISESVFENVYRQADRTLEKIIIDNKEHKEESCLNVLAFLGGRGRGKTSAMSSFLVYLGKLQKENEWSELSKRDDTRFLTLPYIDAAMLADAEYIIDVILAQMWDEFEKYVKSSRNEHNAKFERLERDIKQQFIQVRKSYLILKEREEGYTLSKEMDVPVPSALHELAASINLRDELQKLIDNYLEIFRYTPSEDKYDNYLVIAIDDVDMSGKKAHFILEQVRRYLGMQKVIILITADIDRLQLACESRYTQIYTDDNNRRKFINEYLEKVLPYNMRIYLPEIKERHDEIPIETLAQEKLNLKCEDEKSMILEYMAIYCGIYFDGCRRKRHFLQNQTMRSLVNYFEQMIRMQEDSLAWLKIDLKERIVERIINKEQKDFMYQLISEDYEDVNGYIIAFLLHYVTKSSYGAYDVNGRENSLGQVLYLCRLFEEHDARNTDFVNAVILLYSIILGYTKDELKDNVIGDSLWGDQEYGLISRERGNSAFCLSFDLVGSINFSMSGVSDNMLQNSNPSEIFTNLIHDHMDTLVAWLCSLLFVSIDVKDQIEYDINVDKTEVIIKSPKGDSKWNVENIELGNNATYMVQDADRVPQNWKISLHPMSNARKSYLTNAFRSSNEIYKQLNKMLSGALKKLADWVERNTNDKFNEKAKEIQDKKQEVLREINKIIDFQREDAGLIFNVEIIYSIAKELSKQVRTYEFDQREAYKMLVSSYKIIQEELRKRDTYFKEEVKLDIAPGFEKEFISSPQAQVLLQPKRIPAPLRKKIREKLGGLLIEYRSRTTVLQKPIPIVRSANFQSESLL